jgi:hypothetical protein
MRRDDGWMEEESGCGKDPPIYERDAEKVRILGSDVVSYFI